MGSTPPPWAEKPSDDFIERQSRTEGGRNRRSDLGDGDRPQWRHRQTYRAASRESKMGLGPPDPHTFAPTKGAVGPQPRMCPAEWTGYPIRTRWRANDGQIGRQLVP